MKDLIYLLIIVTTSCYIYTKKNNKLKEGSTNFLFPIILLLLSIIIVPYIFYIFDEYNIPTLLGWGNNLDKQNWLSFLATYVGGVVSTIISSGFLIFVTKYQIDEEKQQNLKRAKKAKYYLKY